MPPQPPPAPSIDDARAQHEEILRRFPPDDPGSLFRASVVCPAWRSLLTSPAFAHSYRAYHGTPPLLGFFENHDTLGVWFEPSSPRSPFPPMHPDHRELFVLDFRHGLVLLRTPINRFDEPAESLIVWDPVGRRQWEFPPPVFAADVIYDSGVVLCDAHGCDHLGCHGGRFRVVYVGTNYSVAHAAVFSSETRAWSAVASFHPPEPILEIATSHPKAIVGNVIYFNGCIMGSIILQFDHVRLELSMIHGPGNGMPLPPVSVLRKTEKDRQDGQGPQDVLGCATVDQSGIRLWSMDAAPDGSVAWTQVIKLELPRSIIASRFEMIGFADGIGVLYLSTSRGIFTVDLESGGVKYIGPVRSDGAIPCIRFCTPDQARTTSGLVGNEGGGGWENVGNGEKEEEQQEEEAAQELFIHGSEAFEDGDYVNAVDCLRRSLEIRVVHHGKLSPRCRDTYYRYGWALLRRAQSWSASNENSVNYTTHEYSFDLDLAWKMLNVARVILEKSPGSTREKVKIFAALAKVSMQREDRDHSFIACLKALDILANLVHRPRLRFIIILNKQTFLIFKFPESGDAMAISLCGSHLQKLKMVNVALLAAEVGLEESSLAMDIQFVTDILLSALDEKLVDLEQDIGNDSWTSSQYSESGSSISTATGMSEDSPVSPYAESDSSMSIDG